MDRLPKFLASAAELTPGTALNAVIMFLITFCFCLFAYTCLIGMISFSEIAANRISRKKSFLNGVRILGLFITAFGILCSIISAQIIGILSWFFAPQLIGFFNSSPEVIDFGTRHMRTISLFYFLLAFSHCIAGIMRGAGKATVPMFTMLGCWCVLRVSYITVAIQYVNRLETVSLAYPITWTFSSIIFLIYFLKADWIHNFDKLEAKNA